MPLARAFRLSFYLSLAMACVCMFYGEWELKFVRWLAWMLPVIFALMYLAYRREGVVYLSEQTANRLGTCIGLGTVFWLAFNVPRSDLDVVNSTLPWPAALVPLLAPLLPILLLVKLFRPKKLGDFWVFQTIALVIVTLSCILAGEPFFFVLLCVFLITQIWCLCLFFLYRNMVLAEAGPTASEPQQGWATSLGFKQTPLFGSRQMDDPTPIPRPCLRPANVYFCSAAVLLAGLGLFLALPRYSDSPWVPSELSTTGRNVKSGIDQSAGLDLFREGNLELSQEPAFEVEARDSHGAPVSLPLAQHWRMQILDEYERGKFRNSSGLSGKFSSIIRRSVPTENRLRQSGPLPEKVPAGLGEDEVYLVFHVTELQAGGLPLADPIDRAGEHVGLFPRFAQGADFVASPLPFFKQFIEGEAFLTASNFKSYTKKKVEYGQVITPKFHGLEIRTLSQADGIENVVRKNYVHHLLAQEMPKEIPTWTAALMKKLPELDEDDCNHGPSEPARHAKIARALSRHLADSGEFTYSLRLHRLGVTMDPIAEFLLKVKEGHCERYAAGLTLMLRSVSIPARIVRGYQGWNSTEKGRHVVRQDQAHSWVEALVPGKEPGTMIWLQLDPTPSATAASDTVLPFLNWAWNRLINPDLTWKSLVMEYNGDRQSEVGDQFKQLWKSSMGGDSIWETVRWPALALLALGTALLVYWGWRRFRGHGAGLFHGPLVGFHARLLKVLESHCRLRPHTGQTPLEFAHEAQQTLTTRLAASDPLAELPVRAVREVYEHLFGGRPLTPETSEAIESEIAHLEKALRAAV